MFQKVYPTDFPELEHLKGIVHDDLYEMFDFIDPYELWYYYMNNYVMRYVNNYYNYEKYSPKLFEKNMVKALHNWCNTQKEKAVEFARTETQVIEETFGSYDTEVVISPTKIGSFEIVYIWITTHADACEKCLKNNNKHISKLKNLHTHWHCRCQIKQIITITDENGNILKESKKTL